MNFFGARIFVARRVRLNIEWPQETTNQNDVMYFGVDYYPEQWVFPYGGTDENPEGAWETDAQLMAKAGINVVRIGDFTWGLCERQDLKI